MTRDNELRARDLTDTDLNAAMGGATWTQNGPGKIQTTEDQVIVRDRTGLVSMEEGESCGI